MSKPGLKKLFERVFVNWGDDIPASRRLHYALELANEFNIDITVNVELGTMPDEDKAVTTERINSSKLFEIFRQVDVVFGEKPRSGDIAINENGTWPGTVPYWVLCPSLEKYFIRYEDNLKILVPIGNDASARRTYEGAMLLARLYSFQLVFFHTTWRDDAVVSDKPDDHMCEEARTLMADAEKAAQEAGVRYVVDLYLEEPTIVDGMVHSAIDHSCLFIIVSHEERTYYGSYPEQLFKESNVPVLLIPKEIDNE